MIGGGCGCGCGLGCGCDHGGERPCGVCRDFRGRLAFKLGSDTVRAVMVEWLQANASAWPYRVVGLIPGVSGKEEGVGKKDKKKKKGGKKGSKKSQKPQQGAPRVPPVQKQGQPCDSPAFHLRWAWLRQRGEKEGTIERVLAYNRMTGLSQDERELPKQFQKSIRPLQVGTVSFAY